MKLPGEDEDEGGDSTEKLHKEKAGPEEGGADFRLLYTE